MACRRVKDGYLHQSMGRVSEAHNLPPLNWSSAGYQARNPFGDVSLVKVNISHPLSCCRAVPCAYFVSSML